MADLEVSVGMLVIEIDGNFVGIQCLGEAPGFLQTIAKLNADWNIVRVVLQVRGVLRSRHAPAFGVSSLISRSADRALRAPQAENPAHRTRHADLGFDRGSSIVV